MELKQLKDLHDKAYCHNQCTRERAAEDTVFYWVTQWDDNVLDVSQLQYRGEFNILRKAGRQILADLRNSPVSIDFQPVNDDREDGADLIDGLFLSDERRNSTSESYDNASMESVVCGVGGWVMYTDYETTRAGDVNQVIRRKPIYEANNNCFWDPNAKRLDKCDANYVSVLNAYSEDGYKDLHLELTGEEAEEVVPSSFGYPEDGWEFLWFTEDKKIYVVEFYHREKVKDKVLTMIDMFDQQLLVRESDLKESMDEMIDSGYTIESEKVIERWEVTKYIASGSKILKEDIVPGGNLPVIPVYGERAFVEGEESYEGITKLAKDPSRLRNFQLSYLADIASRSPRPKPIFNPQDVAGYEYMYEENGAENNYAYLLRNSHDADGNPIPQGQIAQLPDQTVPQALVESIALSREAVEDVANPGIPQDVADPDMSGKAIYAIQNRIDQQSVIYQDNLKHAKRRDAEIYAAMAAEVYDAPRTVTLTKKDGTRSNAEIMQEVIDSETGEYVAINNLSNVEFDVFAEVGLSYSSKKEQTVEQLSAMTAALDPADPLANILRMKQLKLMDGVDFDDVRDYANKQLILMGLKEPETPEEEQALQEAQQQGQEPSPDMVLAQAEMLKGQAAMAREERESQKLMTDVANNNAQTQIDGFEAQTGRMTAQINAKKAGAEIEKTNIETFGKQLENMAKIGDNLRARVS